MALKVEEKELGSRPERLVELYSLMSEIYDEVKNYIYKQNCLSSFNPIKKVNYDF